MSRHSDGYPWGALILGLLILCALSNTGGGFLLRAALFAPLAWAHAIEPETYRLLCDY